MPTIIDNIHTLKERECTREELLMLILDKYEIDEKTAAADLDEFLDKTVQAGIVTL